MTFSPHEPHRWTPEQLQALTDLIELHPGEPMRTDTFATPGQHGPAVVWVGEEHFTIHEDGRLIDHNGVEFGAEALL